MVQLFVNYEINGKSNTINFTIPDKTYYLKLFKSFYPSTNIELSIPPVPMQSGKSKFVTLKIYNLLDQETANLVSGKFTPGNYKYEWDVSGFASCVYCIKLEAGINVQTRKLVLMK